MTEVVTLAQLEDLVLGNNAKAISRALAGRSDECFTARVISFGANVQPRFFTLIFRNRELSNRFSQFTEAAKISFAERIADLLEGSKTNTDRIISHVEIEFLWTATKRRRLRVSAGHRHMTFDRYLRDDVILHVDLI